MNEESLDYLLSLNGISMNYQGEYWVKFDVIEVAATADRPLGIKYSLSLHDGNNRRLMGFDNAHAIKVSSGFKGRKYAYDHVHKTLADPGTEYTFTTPEQLITDFWDEVEKVLATLER
jgi:Family of unknown function (DUF6516)